MPDDQELKDVLAAISARMNAIEGAIAALAPRDRQEQENALMNFDKFEEELLDRYVGMPVDDNFLDLVRRSFADLRTLLEGKS